MPVQQQIYDMLAHLGVNFERVECSDEMVTMDDCKAIDAALGAPTIKTIFLCNRQKTQFYLLSMPADKPFVTRAFSAALSVSRVSFAPADMLFEMLGSRPGGASPLSIVADSECRIRMIVDSDVAGLQRISLNDGTTTTYLSMATVDLLDCYLPAVGHSPEIVNLFADSE